MPFPAKSLTKILQERKERLTSRMQPLQDEMKRINAAEAAYKSGNAARATTLLTGTKTRRKRTRTTPNL